MLYKIIFLGLFLFHIIYAKDLGTCGETFPIQEEHLLKVIQHKLRILEQQGEIAHHQQEQTHKINIRNKCREATTS